MNAVRSLFVGLACLVGSAIVLPSASFAHTEHTEADIKVLRDAASALQQSRPDLASALNAYAEREHKELDELVKEHQEKEEPGERVEPRNEREERAPN